MKNIIINYLPTNFCSLSFSDKKTVLKMIKKQIEKSNEIINTLIN